MKNFTVRDAQQIQVSFDKCKNVKASNLIVIAPEDSPNTDGIHLTHSEDIDISNSVIGTGIHIHKHKYISIYIGIY